MPHHPSPAHTRTLRDSIHRAVTSGLPTTLQTEKHNPGTHPDTHPDDEALPQYSRNITATNSINILANQQQRPIAHKHRSLTTRQCSLISMPNPNYIYPHAVNNNIPGCHHPPLSSHSSTGKNQPGQQTNNALLTNLHTRTPLPLHLAPLPLHNKQNNRQRQDSNLRGQNPMA